MKQTSNRREMITASIAHASWTGWSGGGVVSDTRVLMACAAIESSVKEVGEPFEWALFTSEVLVGRRKSEGGELL